MVIQFNKRDLPDILSPAGDECRLNPRKVPFFEAVAMNGEGVLKTFTAISKLVLQDMQKYPERHNFTLSDIVSSPERTAPVTEGHIAEMPPTEPSMPGAPMAEAKPEMAALEKAVDAGVKVNLGKPFMDNTEIISPSALWPRAGMMSFSSALRSTWTRRCRNASRSS